MANQPKKKRKSRNSERKSDQQDSRKSKKVELPKIKQDLYGVSRALQQSKKRRRQLSSYESQMEGRVLFLRRQEKKTKQSIEKKQTELHNIFEIRKRQQEERMHKEMLSKRRENQLNRLRIHSLTHRENHLVNLEESIIKIHQDKSRSYLLGKRDSMRADKHKEMVNQHDFLRKQSVKLLVDESIKSGAERIQQFKASQNNKFFREYQKRIGRQQIMSRDKLHRLSALEREESRLLSNLQKSQKSQDAIHQKLSKAFDLQLKDLERQVVLRNKSRASSSRSRRSALSSSSTRKGSENQLYSIQSKRDIYSSKKNINPENSSLSRKSSRRNSIAL